MDTLYSYLLAATMLWLQGGRGVSQITTRSNKCLYSTYQGMSSADCSHRNLPELPAIKKGTEILVANMNRIKIITNSTFQESTSLKYLYLQDNFILEIEAGAFSELEDLEVLNLGSNGISSLPPFLPRSLRKLYLEDNVKLQNFTLSSAYFLNFLSLAGCRLHQVPPVGMLPNLQELNLTNNPLERLTPSDLAPFCRLKTLYLPRTLYNTGADAQCHCHRLLTWTSQHYINHPGFNCTRLVDPDKAGCEMDFSAETAAHKACLQSTPPVLLSRYLLIAAVVTCVVVALIVLFCWWRKGRRKQNAVQDNRGKPRCLAAEDKKGADTLIM